MKADKAGIQPQPSLAVIPRAGLTNSPAHCLDRWAEGNSLASACWNLNSNLFPDNHSTFQEQSVLSRNHTVLLTLPWNWMALLRAQNKQGLSHKELRMTNWLSEPDHLLPDEDSKVRDLVFLKCQALIVLTEVTLISMFSHLLSDCFSRTPPSGLGKQRERAVDVLVERGLFKLRYQNHN